MPKHKQLTIEQFKTRFEKVKEKGWVKSKRKGPTGVGQTLEQLLGMKENNVALPDLGTVELKAHRIGSASMITLFTFNRKAWKMKPLAAIKKYGTKDENGRLGMYFTMARTPNSMGLLLHVDDGKISVRHVSGEVVAEWELETLAKRFMQKVPGLVLVSAFSEMRGDTEWFKYDRAQVLTETSVSIIHNQLIAGNILVDLRLHDKGTSARNHGTGFRATEDKLTLLFKNIKEL
ncbi:MAG: hypothetical protein KGJ59_10970 [Bacteroidota bacterium]|nr:hypothetical protein [Bacteroidota bacterium]